MALGSVVLYVQTMKYSRKISCVGKGWVEVYTRPQFPFHMGVNAQFIEYQVVASRCMQMTTI
jgi:hypothetical protein